MPGDFAITVYDKAFNFRNWANAYVATTAHPRHNAISTAEFSLGPNHLASPDLLADGARVVIHYRDEFLMSGTVRLKSGTYPWQYGALTFQVTSDFAVLGEILGYPNAAGATLTSLGGGAYRINNQGAITAYDKRSGAAETVLKGYVTANAARLGIPLTVATDQGRGDAINVSMRMHPLTDRLLPLVDQAGIGVDVRQSGAGLVLDVYEPTIRTRALTGESGILRSGTWKLEAPTWTRCVVAGAGEGTAREFILVADHALEAKWGFKLEVQQDARDTDVESEMIARGWERLAEGAIKSGFAFDLGEGPGFRYGETVRVGDRVTVEPVPGAVIDDVLREVALADPPDQETGQRSTVGADPDPDQTRKLFAAQAAIRKTQRALEAGR